MSFLIDLLEEVSTSSPDPPTSRGLMVLGLVAGIGLCVVNGWLLLTAADPLRNPAWGPAAVAIGLIIPPVMMLLSMVTIRREPEDTRLAATTLAANAAALGIAIATIL